MLIQQLRFFFYYCHCTLLLTRLVDELGISLWFVIEFSDGLLWILKCDQILMIKRFLIYKIKVPTWVFVKLFVGLVRVDIPSFSYCNYMGVFSKLFERDGTVQLSLIVLAKI